MLNAREVTVKSQRIFIRWHTINGISNNFFKNDEFLVTFDFSEIYHKPEVFQAELLYQKKVIL